MQPIGTIQFVQVQRASLKTPDNMVYDPTPLQVVEQSFLTHAGIIGILADGTNIIDVHHSLHHAARKGGGISIGFTSHYDSMRAEFGGHLTDGIAGENIMVSTQHAFPANNLGERLAIQSAATGQIHVLIVTKVVEPCVPFSEFCRRRKLSGEEAKTTLQFLQHGRRGYKLALEPHAPEIFIRAGDTILAETF